VLRVGLTGGIACGKSYVLRRLSAAGLRTLDLDEVARDLTAPGGAAYDDVVRSFGPAILAPDRTIDRRVLGEIVFRDPEARARLDALVHPRVRAEEARRIAVLGAEPGAVVVTDAALLVEAGVHLRFDRLVVVHCPPEEQRKRLRQRDGIDEDAARARLAAQMPIAEKRRFGHLEVDTSGSLADTDREADRVAASLRSLAAAPPEPVAVPTARTLGCLVRGPDAGPRGLRPLAVLADIVAAGGPEMERFARLLSPAVSGPWYRAARGDEPGPGPETLAGPLALWALRRRGRDAEFLAAAAASTARLTHTDPAAIASAVLVALALADVAASDGPTDPAKGIPRWMPLATHWGGAPPSPATIDLLGRSGGEGVGGALAGAAAGVDPAGVPRDARALVRGLERLGS
jgi:dephospho-CoA kinase